MDPSPPPALQRYSSLLSANSDGAIIFRLDDLSLSLCLSFLSLRNRTVDGGRVSRQWNRVAVMPFSINSAAALIQLMRPLDDTIKPSQTLVRWASQRAAAAAATSPDSLMSSWIPLLPSPPAISFGSGTSHPYASSSINSFIADHVGGSAAHGLVHLPTPLLPIPAHNPSCLSELLGWPNLSRATRNARYNSVHIVRRASYEGWCRIQPAKLRSLTIRSPIQDPFVKLDPIKLGGGDEEWNVLLTLAAPTELATSATTGGMQKQPEESKEAAEAATEAATSTAGTIQAAPVSSPFPLLTHLSIEGPALSWPVVSDLIRACPTLLHLTVGRDLSTECMETCELMQSRGPEATVNGMRFNESLCCLCEEKCAPLLTCAACQVTACGPCLRTTADRHHFLCLSRSHDYGAQLYCYAAGSCDNHVGFQCTECLKGNAAHTSPAVCDACGCLACCDEHVRGQCDHFPDLTVRCSKCRCRKCVYRSGTFSLSDKKAASKAKATEAEAEDEDVQAAADGQANSAPRKPQKPTETVTFFRPG